MYSYLAHYAYIPYAHTPQQLDDFAQRPHHAGFMMCRWISHLRTDFAKSGERHNPPFSSVSQTPQQAWLRVGTRAAPKRL